MRYKKSKEKEIIRKRWGRCITCKSDKRADQERREGKGKKRYAGNA